MSKLISFFKKFLNKDNIDDEVEISNQYKCIDSYGCENYLTVGVIYNGFITDDKCIVRVIDDTSESNCYSINRFEEL